MTLVILFFHLGDTLMLFAIFFFQGILEIRQTQSGLLLNHNEIPE